MGSLTKEYLSRLLFIFLRTNTQSHAVTHTSRNAKFRSCWVESSRPELYPVTVPFLVPVRQRSKPAYSHANGNLNNKPRVRFFLGGSRPTLGLTYARKLWRGREHTAAIDNRSAYGSAPFIEPQNDALAYHPPFHIKGAMQPFSDFVTY